MTIKKYMSNRFSIKIVGASGQGINIVGEILAKTFMHLGYGVFAYREYPSLIKGGHSTYQIDIANHEILSVSSNVDLLLVLNEQATKWHVDEMREGGVIFHNISNPRINKDEHAEMFRKKIQLVYIPGLRLSLEAGGNDLTSNITCLGTIYKSLNLPIDALKEVVREKFASKPKIVEIDIKCVEKGYNYKAVELPEYRRRILKPDEVEVEKKNNLHSKTEINLGSLLPKPIGKNNALQLTGNEALAIGAINAGVRLYYSYPMTPTSSILEYLAEHVESTGIVVKQAEDEITAAGMALGSMFMGTRALTGTSGGGFDLMTEHVSLAGMTESPFVIILGQRPGPATGMPSWTAQGDLMLAIFGGHGEYPKCVIGVNDAEDCFYSIQEAFNIAEVFQIPVIVLTDKYIAESIYKVNAFDTEKVPIVRNIVTNEKELEALVSADRYKITGNGISKRWLPGAKAKTFNTNSDEHDAEGNVTEEGNTAEEMIRKRQRKLTTLYEQLEEPVLYSNNVVKPLRTINLIGWGSTYCIVNDMGKELEIDNIKINYLHIKYLWPLKTETIEKFLKTYQDIVLIETNYDGQLGKLIKMQTGIDIEHKLLKWNGRPFFKEEIIEFVKKL